MCFLQCCKGYYLDLTGDLQLGFWTKPVLLGYSKVLPPIPEWPCNVFPEQEPLSSLQAMLAFYMGILCLPLPRLWSFLTLPWLWLLQLLLVHAVVVAHNRLIPTNDLGYQVQCALRNLRPSYDHLPVQCTCGRLGTLDIYVPRFLRVPRWPDICWPLCQIILTPLSWCL